MRHLLIEILEQLAWASLAVFGAAIAAAITAAMIMMTVGAWAIGIGQIIGWVLQ